jgi:ParB family chromosome partitioning protein
MPKPPIKRDRKFEWLPVDKIIPNDKNPRRKEHFTPGELARLRSSIEGLGVLEPIIVEPYRDDLFLIVEGQRRWTSAKIDGIKELPAIVVNRMDEHEQLLTMFNIHVNRRPWEMAEELLALKELLERNGRVSEEELSKELNMSRQTLRERMTVLGMGDEVVGQIAKGDIDYSSALRSAQLAKSLERNRPDVVKDAGGAEAVAKQFVQKAKVRGGISQELVEGRRDLADAESGLSDAAVSEYIKKPEMGIREVRTKALEEARKVDDLNKDIHRLEARLRSFDADLGEAPNLRPLRGALGSLIDAAQGLEGKVSDTLRNRDLAGSKA